MCGIVGYVGSAQATPILIKGLKKLEYRGYDSAGIAVCDGNQLEVIKTKGRISALEKCLENKENLGCAGIGHTRWATHGEPSYANSHPHINNKKTVAVVHNGIIENYSKLRTYLIGKGYHFVSETDTEVVAHLVDYYYNGDPLDTVIKVICKLKGSYALGLISLEHPDQIIAVRKDSPLIVGVSSEGNFIASDIPAILYHTRDIYLLENDEIVLLKKDSVSIYNTDKELIDKEPQHITWDVSSAEKGGYEHFMLKEIMEQPKAVADTINPRITGNKVVMDEIKLSEAEIKNIKKIYIIGCGSAYHVAVVGKYMIEKYLRISVEVDLASEFRYRNPIIESDSAAIIISQSGETADTLAALRELKKNGVKIISVVNVVGSSIARESDNVIYTWAGPEIAVATTKAYSTQLSVLYLITLYFAKIRGSMTDEELTLATDALQKLPSLMEAVLKTKEQMQYIASKEFNAKSIFYLGRDVDYAIALEGSLKLKEISYIHSEAYAAGELKHGTIALIEEGTLVVAVAVQSRLFEKTLSNIKEVKARGAKVVAVVQEGNTGIEDEADEIVFVPKALDFILPSLTVVPLQLFGYYIAVQKGCDVDKPRNLAKSVTVE
jgi:glucosamine--fructose-6-phosphate aminotransferase (isomerizing)